MHNSSIKFIRVSFLPAASHTGAPLPVCLAASGLRCPQDTFKQWPTYLGTTSKRETRVMFPFHWFTSSEFRMRTRVERGTSLS